MDPPAMMSGTLQFMFSMDQMEVIFGANDFWPHTVISLHGKHGEAHRRL